MTWTAVSDSTAVLWRTAGDTPVAMFSVSDGSSTTQSQISSVFSVPSTGTYTVQFYVGQVSTTTDSIVQIKNQFNNGTESRISLIWGDGTLSAVTATQLFQSKRYTVSRDTTRGGTWLVTLNSWMSYYAGNAGQHTILVFPAHGGGVASTGTILFGGLSIPTAASVVSASTIDEWTDANGATVAPYSTVEAWSAATTGRVDSWYQLSAVTDADGVDFQLKVSEQFPVKVNANDPLRIVESAYSGVP